MRKFCLLSLSFSVLSVAAVTLDVARLPEPAFADREVSSDAALPANRVDLLRTFRLELVFDSTPSNNVQVAFGRDNRPADGALAAEETDFIVGWDCGEWFLRPQGLMERFVFTPENTQGRRTLTMEIPVTPPRAPKSVTFKDGADAFTFEGLTLSPCPGWLNPGLWTHLRVTVRGADVAAEDVRARFLQDGARIILR